MRETAAQSRWVIKSDMLITFEGRSAIVAGAARGIGQAIARRLANGGARVIACDRLFEEVETYAGPAKAARLHPRRQGRRDRQGLGCQGVVDGAGGPVDVLVYVAGGIRGQRPKPLEEVPVEDIPPDRGCQFDRCVPVLQAVAPGMKPPARAALSRSRAAPPCAPSLTGIQAYASAKHGQLGLVRQLSHDSGSSASR